MEENGWAQEDYDEVQLHITDLEEQLTSLRGQDKQDMKDQIQGEKADRAAFSQQVRDGAAALETLVDDLATANGTLSDL